MSKVRTFIALALVCVSLAFAGCCGCDFDPCGDPCAPADGGGEGGGDGGGG